MGSTCSTPSYSDPGHNIPTIPKTPFGPLPVYKQQPKQDDLIEESEDDPDKEPSETDVTAESTLPDSLEQKEEEEITTKEDAVAQDAPPKSAETSVPKAPECE